MSAGLIYESDNESESEIRSLERLVVDTAARCKCGLPAKWGVYFWNAKPEYYCFKCLVIKRIYDK